jgi:hypothetical protein
LVAKDKISFGDSNIIVESKKMFLVSKLDRYKNMLAIIKQKFPWLMWMLVLTTWRNFLYMPRMNINILLVNILLLWTYSNVLYLLTTNKNMSNLPQFITFFFMNIPWLILKASKFSTKCLRWKMFMENTSLIHQTRALQKLYMVYCQRLQKLHLHLLLS